MQVNTVVLVRIFSGINFAAGPGPPECEMAGSPVIGAKIAQLYLQESPVSSSLHDMSIVANFFLQTSWTKDNIGNKAEWREPSFASSL